ncbi:hypothetical protein ELD05_08705 [Caldicellulosiruptor changbaiensis]|uniref:ATP-binding protein n=2 Tax=Caldicellulosiruptor changbaiensis TaxID=1222016 RepID=A0A3T0D6Y1_9FIRM|nr:hypothetical protein ELD05_08705 [Caldicellulosiruptor changbaiensis]
MCMTVPLSFVNRKTNIFVGTAGSGKSEIALNVSLELGEFFNVNLIDADVINLYYNLRSVKDLVERKNINFISTHFEGKSIDLPILSGKVYEALNQQNAVNIVDVGGDEIGSAVIGQFRELFSKKGYNLFYVANIYRPFNSTKEEILENMREIENILGMNITAIINNSHLLSDTKPENILKSLEIVQDVANTKDIPYVLTVVEEKLFEQDLLEEIKKYSLVYAIKRYIIR